MVRLAFPCASTSRLVLVNTEAPAVGSGLKLESRNCSSANWSRLSRPPAAWAQRGLP